MIKVYQDFLFFNSKRDKTRTKASVVSEIDILTRLRWILMYRKRVRLGSLFQFEGQRAYFKWRIFFNSSTRKKGKIVLREQKYLDFLVVLNGAYLKKM